MKLKVNEAETWKQMKKRKTMLRFYIPVISDFF